MNIRFSMSSQLWHHIKIIENIRKYVIASVLIENYDDNSQKINYIILYNIIKTNDDNISL